MDDGVMDLEPPAPPVFPLPLHFEQVTGLFFWHPLHDFWYSVCEGQALVPFPLQCGQLLLILVVEF
jgi:hypothetical protein